jgi:hypothetical protein
VISSVNTATDTARLDCGTTDDSRFLLNKAKVIIEICDNVMSCVRSDSEGRIDGRATAPAPAS